MKLKTYEEFFADVEAEGEFTCFDYDDDVKQSIIQDFDSVFIDEQDEPLTPFIDDVLETAQLREVRVFPENEFMYVRAEIRLRGVDGEFGEPYQILALWDCFCVLKSYTFVKGEEQVSVIPKELGLDE